MKWICFLLVLLSACVPKARYEDQQEKLRNVRQKLQDIELEQQNCDSNLFLQLKEQVQSLDVLTQELLEKNTALSQEVSGYQAYKNEAIQEKNKCEKLILEKDQEWTQKLERTRLTLEDLIEDLKRENTSLKDEMSQLKQKQEEIIKSKSNKKRAKNGK